MIATSLFIYFLPDSWKVNESSDFVGYYEPIARNILSGNGYTIDGTSFTAYYPPGYPVILAMLFWISRVLSVQENIVLTVFQVIFPAVSVTIIFYIVQKITNNLVGLVTAGLWMTYPFMLWLTKQPNSEISFMVILFLSFAIFVSACLWTKKNILSLLLSGFFLGLAILIRPIGVFFPVVFVISLFFMLPQSTFKGKAIRSFVFIAGVIISILPWEAYVYANTGKVPLISENKSMALRGGLIFAVSDRDYKQPVPVPEDVEELMLEIVEDYDSFYSTGKVLSFLGEKLKDSPLTVFKLFGIKALRSWYATDSQRLEKIILFVQIPYLILMVIGSVFAWTRGDAAKKIMVILWLLALCNWGMTILVTSTLRYMVPVIGLQFVNIAQVPYFLLHKYSNLKTNLSLNS